MNTCKDDLATDLRTGRPDPVEADLTLIAERGNWSIETFEQDHREHYRLRRGGIKVLDVAPDDISDLFDLFMPGVLEHGFEQIAKSYADRTLPEDGALHDFSPSGCPMSIWSVLDFYSDNMEIGEWIMPNDCCRQFGLPPGSSYREGVRLVFEGYAAGRFTRPRPDTSATGTTVIDPDEEAFIRSLG